ncbi:MAG TPA: mannose-1-phosphate guanylyltransferase [Acidobacteriota bacterium]
MAGGSGTRFWPRSRKRMPKQLLALIGDSTMLERTAARIRPLVAPERTVVVTNGAQQKRVGELLPWLDRENLLVEPIGRSTAPCLILAALRIAAADPDAIIVSLAADHVIQDEAAFRGCLEAALAAADPQRLVTFGIVPRYPETGYGYVELADPILKHGDHTVYRVARFCEKPDRSTAQAFLTAGNFLWNSGMFVWRASAFLSVCRRHLPEVVQALEPYAQVPARSLESGLMFRYADLPEISVDVGVMEQAEQVACVRGEFGWSDIGSWSALAEVLPADADGNVSRGELVALSSGGNVVDAPDKLVALLGIKDCVVVDTPDALLVCAKDHAQDVRRILEALKSRGRTDLL